MRTSTLRHIVPLFLAIASVAAPAAGHAAPATVRPAPIAIAAGDGITVTGLYRLTMSAADRKAKTVHLLVRIGDLGMSGVVLDKDSEVEMLSLYLDGTVLKGGVMTSEGYGELELELRDGAVKGTLKVGGKQIAIEGDHRA